MSLEDVFFFRPMNESSTIYLPEQDIMSVQDHLNKILEGQQEKQKELREKKRRMNKDGHVNEIKSDIYHSDAKEEVKLQLVTA